MVHPDLQRLQDQLAKHTPHMEARRSQRQRSAVAVILREHFGQLEVLMIKRAENERDPWSGHMAFPGGRLDPGDAHGYAAAVRETEEEIGLLLGEGEPCLGRLSELNAARPGSIDGMFVTPYVFHLSREVSFTPNYEVADVVWIPLPFLQDASNRDSLEIEREDQCYVLPCYHFGQYCVWGLSLMMLDEMLELLTLS